jgi:glucan-binding YG repeat protein
MDIETNFDGLSDYVVRFVNTFKQLSPLQLGIYSYTSFIEYIEDIQDTIKDYPFWEANYGKQPWNLNDTFFTNRIGHQYSETGSISGINCNCDVNSFTEGVLLNNSTKKGTWLQGLEDNSKWWYKHDDGSFTKDNWEFINDKWYYFDSEGWMLYDWKKYGNTWYYLGDSNDGSAKQGWILNNNKWYYFDENYAMIIGWKQINNSWYYFNTDGSMATGWIKDKGKDYMLYSNGEMVCNCDYVGYHFDKDGVALKL